MIGGIELLEPVVVGIGAFIQRQGVLTGPKKFVVDDERNLEERIVLVGLTE